MAASGRDPRKFWVINDSGSAPVLHLAGIDGADFGALRLAGAENVDWEDLASFEHEGKRWLLVADVGDNNARRRDCALYLLEEPAMPEKGGRLAGKAPFHRVIRFRYEGGPRDCESVAVDVAAGKIILVSKRTSPPEIHELPLAPAAGDGVLTTRRVGELRVEMQAGNMIPYGNQPTALDFSPDGRRAAVLTYFGVFVFTREPDESWQDGFVRKPVVLPPHVLPQAEALAFMDGGRMLAVLTEGRNPPLVIYSAAKAGDEP